MKVILITQNDPFYLGRHIDYFFRKLPLFVTICGVILLDVSPFGKPNSFLKRMKRTYSTFGLIFFLRYSWMFILSQFFNRNLLIKNVLRKHEVNEIQLPQKNINAKDCIDYIGSFEPDLVISVAANQIFKRELLKLPKFGCINLHTSLLPDYKGLMPTFWAMKNNEEEMGVSVFKMDEGIDTGGIIVQKTTQIREGDSLEALIDRTKRIGMDALIEAIFLIEQGLGPLRMHPSKEGRYYSFPKKEDVREFKNAGKKFW